MFGPKPILIRTLEKVLHCRSWVNRAWEQLTKGLGLYNAMPKKKDRILLHIGYNIPK